MGLAIELGNWSELGEEALAIRHAVFVREQGVPEDMELDESDPVSIHAIARDEQGNAVGTGRLLPDGHIGRMAVMPPARGHGVGSAILQALLAAARRDGHRAVVLNAQIHALPFYRKHGFLPQGSQFDDAGLPHMQMQMQLSL